MSKRFLLWLAKVAGISTLVLFPISPVSCKATEKGIHLLQGDYVPPILVSYEVKNEQDISLTFSEKIAINGVVITRMEEQFAFVFDEENDEVEESAENGAVQARLAPSLAAASGENGGIFGEIFYSDEGHNVTIRAAETLEAGTRYEIYGEAQDENSNTLTFCVPFTGFNARVPRIIISSIYPQYKSDKGVFKHEFVEIFALTSGNLAGIKIQSANYGAALSFTLPAVEVQVGERIVVHLRTKGEGCISETGDDLTLATGWHTSNIVRDLWSSNEKKCLGDKEDVIALVNTFSDEILDAVMYTKNTIDEWSKESVKNAAKEVCALGFWPDSSPTSAVIQNITPSKMLVRTNCAALLQAAKNGLLPDLIKQDTADWTLEAAKANY